MSQVHSVTHVPVHSPLRGLVSLLRAEPTPNVRDGVAGRNRPAVVDGGRRAAAGDRRGAQLLPLEGCFHRVLGDFEPRNFNSEHENERMETLR